METLLVKKTCEKRIASGHLWIFSNELESIPDLPIGVLVKIVDSKGKDYGLGFYNPQSLIAVRLLYTKIKPDTSWFIEKIKNAYKLRKTLLRRCEIYRLCYGESDYLPGLLIDKYEDCFAIQILSAGMQRYEHFILEALKKVFPKVEGIIAKNSSQIRELEGLQTYEEVLYGNVPDEIYSEEYGVKLSLSIKTGQKTGYFLDQRDNRVYSRRLNDGGSVLDCFTNQGGFALNAAKFGAENVIGIDISETALESARKNADLNGLENVKFIKADVFDYLNECKSNSKKFDTIILDPPAYTKTKKNVPTAKAGYAKINRMAMELIKKGGFLVTSSCSYHIREDVFYDIILTQAKKLHRNLSLIYRGQQSADHPIHPAMPETKYLKFFVFRVC